MIAESRIVHKVDVAVRTAPIGHQRTAKERQGQSFGPASELDSIAEANAVTAIPADSRSGPGQTATWRTRFRAQSGFVDPSQGGTLCGGAAGNRNDQQLHAAVHRTSGRPESTVLPVQLYCSGPFRDYTDSNEGFLTMVDGAR